MGRMRLMSLTGVVAGLTLGMGVLAFGGGAEAQEASIEDTVDAAVAAWNEGDAETFITFFTDEGLEQQFEVTRDEAVEALSEEMELTGPIASAEVSDVRLAGGVFTGIVDLQFVAGFSAYEEWEFVQGDDGWLIGTARPASRPIPPGVPAVEMALDEYAFIYNEDAINAADGNFAFDVTNVGQEEHEIVVLSIDSDKPLLELLASADPESEDMPEGLEFVAFGGFYEAGAEGTSVFDQPFAPGKYGLVCFIPAPDGTPHAFLGMISEFEVSGGLAPAPTPGGGITPPNTGDAGLLGGGSSATTWVVLTLALTLVLGGTAGLVKSRVTSSV